MVKNTVDSFITNLNIQNWPVHCFTISGGSGLTISGINLDNTAGNEPNSASDGLAAAHNSDGFDISSTTGLTLEDSVVNNQDDCVAVTSGSDILVTGMTCIGGHGLSIGSIGGKSNNDLDGVTFSNSSISDSENGCRIKSNSGTTGTVSLTQPRGLTDINTSTGQECCIQRHYALGHHQVRHRRPAGLPKWWPNR